MKNLGGISTLCLAAATVLASAAAQAQTSLTPAERSAAVGALAQVIEDEYFDEVRAEALAHDLRADLDAGVFNSSEDAESLAEQLTEILREQDRHFAVRFAGDAPQAPRPEMTETGPQQDPWAALRRQNFGFVDVSILPGNLGYIRLDQFAPIEPAAETASAALDFVANTDAVIFDLRENRGGAPSMVQFLISHFLAPNEPVMINTFVSRDYEYPNQMWSLPSHPSGFRPDTPLYVLVSGRSGSAGEAFPYHLQAMERATIIGETTYGAGNPGETFAVPGGFRIFVSTGSARNPITQSNWEGTGVTPDIPVPADTALERARIEAYQDLIAVTEDALLRENLQWAADQLQASMNPQMLDDATLDLYVGQYGIRSFSAENGQLIYTRQGRPPEPLLALGDHRFAFTDTVDFMLEFKQDGTDPAHAVEIQVADGRRMLMPRRD